MKHRIVKSTFWTDPFVESLDPTEKLVFLYLLTNDSTNIAGVYEITTRRIAFETGIDRDMIQKILTRFEESGKVKYRNGFVILRNFLKHQNNNPSVRAGIDRVVNELPESVRDEYELLTGFSQANDDNMNPDYQKLTDLISKKYPNIILQSFDVVPLLNRVFVRYGEKAFHALMVDLSGLSPRKLNSSRYVATVIENMTPRLKLISEGKADPEAKVNTESVIDKIKNEMERGVANG